MLYFTIEQRLAAFLPMRAAGWAEQCPQAATGRPKALETGTGRKWEKRKKEMAQREGEREREQEREKRERERIGRMLIENKDESKNTLQTISSTLGSCLC
jgi:hypothetical protein